MYRSLVLHSLDYNFIAPCEEWYYRYHGPQIARRYGPWLERFESYRPVPLPKDFSEETLGYTNWLMTEGYWREIPKEGPMGEQSMTTPPYDARNFSVFLDPQYEDDIKGAEYAPEEKACLRLLMLWSYPEGVDIPKADAWIMNQLKENIANIPSVYRIFSQKAIQEEIHLPGGWKPEHMKKLMENGNPSDHHWNRVTQFWFETFDEARQFFSELEKLEKPDWAETDTWPYLKPYENMVSTFLLERPAYDWKREWNVYR